jgi:hypothetical protein
MINSLLNQPRPQAPTQTRGSRRNQGTAQQIKAPGDEAGILPKVVSALFTTLNRGGGRQSLFMFNFVILAGMVSRVWSKIVAAQDLSFECLTIRPANAMYLCKAQSVRVAVILFGVKPDGKKYFIYFPYDAFHAT